MGKFKIEDVRNSLIECGFLTKEQSAELSDEQLSKYYFVNDLGMDSLDVIILAQDLEKISCLVIPDDEFWECRTVQDVLDIEC